MTQNLKLHNSLSREKQIFQPLDAENVVIYVCGPTVYNYAHIGNARAAVAFDVLVKVLRSLYPKVTHVSNITDVEDKIIDAALKQGLPISEITQKYTKIYNDDMAALGVKIPDHQPLATEYIDEMIKMTQILIDKGNAYEKEGHVLFHVPSYERYGILSGRNRDEQIAGARVEVAPYKKDAADFVLWKPSTEEQPGWDSPWGKGRPGWHIECSAMSKALCGDVFDIHAGGCDLTFPHHDNEIAQSCCANDSTEMARYWVHNGFLTVEGEKMAKSTGNVLLVHELIKTASGEALRMNLMSAHYRQPLDWTGKSLEGFEKIITKFYRQLSDIEGYDDIQASIDNVPQKFLAAICDDMNTPLAISELHSLFKDLVKAENPEDKLAIATSIKSAADMLGLLQDDPKAWLNAQSERKNSGAASDSLTDAQIDALVSQREQARANKDFALSDSIRDELDSLGIEIQDSAEGTKWSR